MILLDSVMNLCDFHSKIWFNRYAKAGLSRGRSNGAQICSCISREGGILKNLIMFIALQELKLPQDAVKFPMLDDVNVLR